MLPVAIVLNLPERLCAERNKSRADRTFGPHVVRNQSQELRRGIRGLDREGFRHVHILKTPEEVEAAIIDRQPLGKPQVRPWAFRHIGDVHGCLDELVELLSKLGYQIDTDADGRGLCRPAGGRRSLWEIWWTVALVFQEFSGW